MTTFVYSQIANGSAIEFNFASDVLQVDATMQTNTGATVPVGARWFDIFPSDGYSGRGLEFVQMGLYYEVKSIVLLLSASADPLNMLKLTSANFTFGDGSLLLVGDNTTGTANDDTTTAALTGTAFDDQLISFGGSQTLNGGDGNDRIVTMGGGAGTSGGSGTDVMIGGAGIDTLALGDVAGMTRYVVDLSTGTGSVEGANPSSFTVSGFEAVDGSIVENVITGSAGQDSLYGGEANDSLYGGGGNDYLEGWTGANLLDGGTGNDNLVGYSGADTLLGGEGDDMLDGGWWGDDVFDGGAGVDTLVISNTNVTVSLGITEPQDISVGRTVTISGIENLTGGNGSDYLTGNDGDNWLIGDFQGGGPSSNDTLDGGLGNDYLSGMGGIDWASYALAPAAIVANLAATNNQHVTGGAGTDTLYLIENLLGSAYADTLSGNVSANELDGGAGNDEIFGADGNDTLRGGPGDDYLSGGSGTDSLDGGVGADSMAGGLGNDTYVVNSTADVVTESADAANGGIDLVKSSVTRTLGDYQENLTLTGTALANGTGNDLANQITGNTANNLLKGLTGNDTLLGAAGNDTLDGGLGDDSLNGGGGNDTFFVDSLGDTLTDGAGIDTVKATLDWTLTASFEHLTLIGATALKGTGNLNANRITGNNLANTLSGGGGNDTLTGNNGNDTLTGGAGSDSLVGGLGNDTYAIDVGDTISELSGTTEGIDTVKAGFSYVLGDNLEKLTLTGSAAIDGTGNAAANTLWGNGGANRLDGKEGNDVLTGGLGADTFVFSSALGTDIDTIKDFKTDDVIALDSAVFGSLPTTLEAGNFLAATVAGDTDDFLLYDTGSGALYYDADGSGTAAAPVQFAIVWNGTLHPTLAHGDFLVIS